MRRSALGTFVTGLVLTCAIAAGVSATSAAGGSRTVEIPGGLTVTLSTDWRIWSGLAAADDPTVFATDVPARPSCSFRLVENARTADGAAHEALEMLEGHRQLEVLDYALESVPAGHAVRVSHQPKLVPAEERFVIHEYYVSGPDGVARIICQGVDPPADRWLSIVESLEILWPGPQRAWPFDPRVEVPEPGLAVDFGAEWQVQDWAGHGVVLGGPRGNELGLPEEATTVLRAVTTSEGRRKAECVIEDVTGVPGLLGVDSPTEWQEAFVASAEAGGRQVSVPDVTTVDLGSEHTVRADWERWRGTPASAWVFVDAERRVVLFCRADDPPVDRWRSIAETFEFLRTG